MMSKILLGAVPPNVSPAYITALPIPVPLRRAAGEPRARQHEHGRALRGRGRWGGDPAAGCPRSSTSPVVRAAEALDDVGGNPSGNALADVAGCAATDQR